MKTKLIALLVFIVLGTTVMAQFDLKKAKALKDKASDKKEELKNKTQAVTDEQSGQSGNLKAVGNNVLADLGEIKFSKKPIVYGQTNDADFTTDFSLNDHIYAIVYLKKKMNEIGSECKGATGWHFGRGPHTEIDYNTYLEIKHFIDGEELDKDYYIFDIIPDPAFPTHKYDADNFIEGLVIRNNNRDKMKTAELQFWLNGKPYAKGNLNLSWEGYDYKKLKDNAKLAADNYDNKNAINVQLPEEFSKPTHTFKSPELSQANLKKMMMRDIPNIAEVKKIVVLGDSSWDDYFVRKTSAGIPEYMTTHPNIMVAYKTKDGWCYYNDRVQFKKDYIGGGNYGTLSYQTINKTYKIDCANVK